jgi:putative hemolysin
MLEQITILILLLLLSCFFSSSETAFFSISKSRARHLAKMEDRSYQLIEKMKEDPHKLLTTILIGNNVVNVGAAALATSVAISIFPNYAVGIATIIMTLLILVFGEVLPKSIAARNNIFIARVTVYPIYWLSILFSPIIKSLLFIPRITGRMQKTPSATEEELMTFVEVIEEEGEIKEEEKKLIHKIFEFDDTQASEAMTPRADMCVIKADAELDLEELVRSGFTRIPVVDGDLDNVIGIVNIKDLFLHRVTAGQKIEVRKIMRKPDFVPENKKLDRLLKQFKLSKSHMAIVVDEHGGVSGLITLEDALEEIVGDIRDETDKDESHIVKSKEKQWIVLGKSDIEEVNDIIGMDIPDSTTYDTFSGYILDHIGRIPEEKEEIKIGRYLITVAQKEGNRILQYTVEKL